MIGNTTCFTFILATIYVALSSCSDNASVQSQNDDLNQSIGEELVFDVNQFLGADRTSIASRLGEPTTCEQESVGDSCYYAEAMNAGDALSIFFMDDRATNLTLPHFDLPFEQGSLSKYGIKVGDPEFSNEFVKRWATEINGIPVRISMFPGENDLIYYVYVMSEEYEKRLDQQRGRQ